MTLRTRTTNYERIPGTIEVFDSPPGIVVETQNGADTYGYQSITDISTPGYSKLKRQGTIILSPATIERVKVSNPSDSLAAYGPPDWGYREWRGALATALVPDAPESPGFLSDVSNARQNVINEVYAKAYNGSAQLGVTIAEGNKTLQMIRQPLGRARNILEQMIRRKTSLINKGIGVSKAIASTWLEYRLGFKPVLYDIQNIIDATANQIAGNRTTERQVARSSKALETYANVEVELLAQLRFHEGRARSTKSVSYRISAGVIYETRLLSDEKSFERVRHNYGLQLRDVLRTGWELVPFSFVVDRFIDVGTWLEAIQPNPNVTILGSWVSTKRSTHSQRQILYLRVNTSPPAITGPSSMFTGESTMLTREVGVVPGVIPTPNTGKLSLSQHADHIALITSLCVSFRRKS